MRRARNYSKFWTLSRRRWAYGVAIALVPVAVIAGWITDELAAAVLPLAAAVFGVTGLALANPTQNNEQ